MSMYKELGIQGEDLWIEFISVFRPHTIKLWDHLLLTGWISMFKQCDVHIEKGRAADKAQKVIDLLFRKNHIGGDDSVSAVTQEEKCKEETHHPF